MHSRIEILAEYRSTAGGRPGAGRTVVRSIRAGQHLAGRETGPGIVHLVGTAAGPLGGDTVSIVVRLGAGARLAIRSAGATIVQPGPKVPDSTLRLELGIEDEARLDYACEPAVICHRAEHQAETEVELAGSGQIRLLEQVLLGRSHEPGGHWVGRTRLTRDGGPVLRHTLRSSLIGGTRVISTLIDSGVEAVPATVGDAVAMPLAAGGLLVTATGTDMLGTQADLLAAAARAVPVSPTAGSGPRDELGVGAGSSG
jgi:urease accessory protein